MRRLVASAILAIALQACGFGVDDVDQVPDAPTFERDVAPLFHDHCTLCHGAPPARGAPGHFRLDVYADTPAKLGAQSMAFSALRRVEADDMPPAASWGDGLGPNGKKLLRRWVEQGAPER